MRNLIFILIVVLLGITCTRTIEKKEIFNNDFKWKITIPENFEVVSAEKWAEKQKKGADAIEKTYNEKVENLSKIIFVFKSTDLNYFESNYQPFDTLTDGDYLESCKSINEILYQTFVSQMPGIIIDTLASTETIDNLTFQTFKVNITYPNKMTLNTIGYSRLFGNKELSVNIMYVDKKKGEAMLNSWRNSKFEK